MVACSFVVGGSGQSTHARLGLQMGIPVEIMFLMILNYSKTFRKMDGMTGFEPATP
jgi:hypothetical protein